MADYLEELKKEYPGMFGPVGSSPMVASHEFATEWYRPGSDERWARMGELGSAPLLDIDPKTGVDILYPEGTIPKVKTGTKGPMPVIEPPFDPVSPDIKRPKPYDPLTDPELLRMMGEEPMYDVSLPRLAPDPYLGAMPGGPTEVDEESGETLVYSMITGRMTGPSGGKYETRLVEEAAAHKAEMARRDAEELEKYGPGGYYASEEYKHKSKLAEAAWKRPKTLTYWTKDKPWSVEASREKYPDWHPLDTMPAWYTRYYRDPDSAAHDALTAPDMKIWGIGPGKKDPLSDSVGGISFKSPDLKRTFSSDDDAFKGEDGKHTGMIPETPAMAAAMAGEIPEGTRWVTPEWLTPRSRELGGGPKSLYDVPMDSALTDEILREYRPDDPTTRIGPMVIEKEATGVGMDDPPPEYYPTAYPDLAWYTSWGDAERIAGYPASWDYTDVVKDRIKAVAEDRILDPAAEWAGEVTDLDRLVSTFATDYRGEDPREYLEERTDPEYYPLPKYVTGMHGDAGGMYTTGERFGDWYSKVLSMDGWYGGEVPEDDPYLGIRTAERMERVTPEMMKLLEDIRIPGAPGVAGAPIETYTGDPDEPLEDVALVEEMLLGGLVGKAALHATKLGLRGMKILEDTTGWKSISSAERAFLKRFGSEARRPITKSPTDYSDITLKVPGVRKISELEAFRRLVPISTDDATGIFRTAARRLYGESDDIAVNKLKADLKRELTDHDFSKGTDDYLSYLTGMAKSRMVGATPRPYGSSGGYRRTDDAVRKAAGEYFTERYPDLGPAGFGTAIGTGAAIGAGTATAFPFSGATYSMGTKPDFLSSWAKDLPFIGLAGGFEVPGVRDRMAAAYGYSPKLMLGEGHEPGAAAKAAEDALTRVIGEGDSEIFSVPDYIPVSDVGSSFADYIRAHKAPGDARYLTPTKADITKLWAEDIVRPAFETLGTHRADEFTSGPISYTYGDATTPWLLPSGEAPTLDFSVEGLFEAATK